MRIFIPKTLVSALVGITLIAAPVLALAAANRVGQAPSTSSGQAGTKPAKATMTERREAVIRGFFLQIIRRFDSALERLHDFIGRMQSRISRMPVDHKNRVQAQAVLDRANAKWREAKQSFDQLKMKLERSRTAGEPQAAFREARALLDTTKKDIKTVHAALADTIALLKGIGLKR